MFVTNVIRLQSEYPLKLWATTIEAIDPQTGELKIYAGAYVPGKTKHEAQQYCFENGLGFCEVIGVLVEVEEEIEICLN
jgi:hypothetical protein